MYLYYRLPLVTCVDMFIVVVYFVYIVDLVSRLCYKVLLPYL